MHMLIAGINKIQGEGCVLAGRGELASWMQACFGIDVSLVGFVRHGEHVDLRRLVVSSFVQEKHRHLLQFLLDGRLMS